MGADQQIRGFAEIEGYLPIRQRDTFKHVATRAKYWPTGFHPSVWNPNGPFFHVLRCRSGRLH